MECAESCKDIECKGENERCRGNPNKGGKGTCVCDSGFKQDTNGTCVDIDECEELQVPPCSQVNLFIGICCELNVLQFKGKSRKKKQLQFWSEPSEILKSRSSNTPETVAFDKP